MGKPIVVLTVGRLLDRVIRYQDALQECGLEVRVVSPRDQSESDVERWMEGVQGLVLSGGGDIDPEHGASEPHPTVGDTDPERDRLEHAAFHFAWERDLPVLAICRGMQVMNWALGGTLHADIDALVEPQGKLKLHRQTEYGKERHEVGHPIDVLPGTRLAEAMGAGTLDVNTLHHQALDRVADPLRVNAVSPDGIVEGVEAPDRPFVVGVQYHPECMFRHHPHHLKLFEAFARAVATD